jgi:adenosylhomocysteine nucleosidase
MTFGIIGAMAEEIVHLKQRAGAVETKVIAGMEFNIGCLNGKRIVLVISGIGKVNAAVCAQILIDRFNADAVINTGIAGSMHENVHLGDVVVSTDLVHHDFDTRMFDNDPKGFIPRLNKRFFEADPVLRDLAYEGGQKALNEHKCHKGRIASGDQFVSDPAVKREIADIFEPLAVEMEGAAIAHTCYLNKVPFVVIRSVSDNSDGDADTYESYAGVAAKNSADIVWQIVEDYRAN